MKEHMLRRWSDRSIDRSVWGIGMDHGCMHEQGTPMGVCGGLAGQDPGLPGRSIKYKRERIAISATTNVDQLDDCFVASRETGSRPLHSFPTLLIYSLLVLLLWRHMFYPTAYMSMLKFRNRSLKLEFKIDFKVLIIVLFQYWYWNH
jgi:hypothetical protein